jgi:mRNA interferase RelE/StbE
LTYRKQRGIIKQGEHAMQVLLHPIPAKYLTRLNADDRRRIKDALRGLEKEPPEGYIRPIVGQSGSFRVKVGSYRALYRIKDNAVFVTHIEPRGQAYAKKTKKGRGKK